MTWWNCSRISPLAPTIASGGISRGRYTLVTNRPFPVSDRAEAFIEEHPDFAGAIERNVPSDEDEVVHKEDGDDVDRLFEVLAPGRYEYVPLPTDGAKNVQNGDIIATLFTTGWERGKVEDIDRASPSQKRVAKGFSVPRLVRYVSDSSYWLHDLDDPTIYLTEEQFNNLNAGSPEASEGVKVGAWCVVRRTDSPRNPSPGVLV